VTGAHFHGIVPCSLGPVSISDPSNHLLATLLPHQPHGLCRALRAPWHFVSLSISFKTQAIVDAQQVFIE
jgi:hypothetical protein